MDRWSQLSMSEKSDLMSLYIKNGISSLEEIKKHYNSYQDGGKITFQQWKDRMKTKYPDIEMDNDKAGYNYEEYFNNNYDAAIRQLDNLQHFPDTYKLPNHPTFSNESIYSRGPMIGGNWVNDSTFSPSIINRQQYPEIYKENRPYTEREIYGNEYQQGGYLGKVTPLGQWQYPHQVTTIPSNNITMKGVDYPVIGISDTGDTKYMLPNMDYLFDGNYVTEYPVHKFQDGGPDDDNIFVASQASETGWMPEIKIEAEKPAWQRGLTDYDWARVRQYYSDADGNLTNQGIEFLKNISSQKTTGQSNFMRDVNKLSYIPNAAMLGAGALSGAALNPYLWTAIGLASAAQNIEDKNYKEAALDLGLTLGIPVVRPAAKMINTAVESTKFGKAARTAAEINKAINKTKFTNKEPYLNVGWAPKQDINVYHASNEPLTIENLRFPDYNNWAVSKGAPADVIYLAEGDKPVSGFLTQRPYLQQWEVSLNKPMIQVGEIPTETKNLTRGKLLRQAQSQGADAMIFDGIADNQMKNQRIIADFTKENLNNRASSTRLNKEYVPTLEQAYRKGMNPKVHGSSTYESLQEEYRDFLTKTFLGQVVDPSTSFTTHNYLYQPGVDYIERGISPEVRNIVETQVKPRLLTEDTRFHLAGRDPSYATDFNNAINETVKSTEVSEWSKRMMEDYNRVNNVNWGGFSLNDKPRIIIGKNSNMPVSTTETHELRHQLQNSVPRTPTEQNVLKEAYGDVPQPRKGDGSIDASYDMSQEWETMNTEARKILLEKAGYKYDATKSLEENVIEQDRILENYKNSDLVKTLHDEADGYWRRFIDEFQSKSTEEKRAKVAAWKKAMQLVGASAGIIGTGDLS